jgi:hypothetical protein
MSVVPTPVSGSPSPVVTEGATSTSSDGDSGCVDSDLDEIMRISRIAIPGERSSVYREVHRGALVRMAPGAMIPTGIWTGKTPEQQHRLRAIVVAERRPGLVFSHRTAAILWDLPLLGGPPERLDSIRMLDPGGHGDAIVRLHRTTVPFEVVAESGLRMTTASRTLLDLARTASTPCAVVALDAARARGVATLEGLRDELAKGSARGSRRAADALELSDARSGSPGESWSRVVMRDGGLRRPALQVEHRDAAGLIGFVDFEWPQQGIVGEFDGLGKYWRQEFTGGRSAADIVIAEKIREDRLRSLGLRVVRWGWADLRNPSALLQRLRAAGVPREQEGRSAARMN